jgi:hypothetical protein
MSRITYINLSEDVRQFPNTEAVFSGSTSFVQGIKVKGYEIDTTLNPTYGDGLFFNGTGFTSSPMTSYQDEIINGMNVGVDSSNALILNISGGTFKLKGTIYAFTGQSVTLTTGDTINPRFDIIYVNSASTINILQGTPSPSPALPTLSNDFLDVSIVFVTAGYFSGSTGTTIINNNQVTVIGNPEDDTYSDGLFTDFTPTTRIGVSIDRFNEVLKALAPSPAPNLYELNTVTSHPSARLSFGVSKPISGYTNVTGVTSLSAVDVNQNFITSGYRKGVFRNSPANIIFNLNDIVTQTSGYSGKSFNEGNLGILNLYLNGSVINTLNLTSTTGATSNSQNNTTISASSVTNIKSNTGADFNLFKYRTGTVTLNRDSWQNGYNHCKVEHVIDSIVRSTNFVDFIHDHTASNNLTVSNTSLTRNQLLGERYLSGVKYNTGATFTYDCTISNYYINVYPATSVTNAFSFNLSSNISSSLNSSIVLSGTGLTSSITGNSTTTISAQTITTGATSHLTDVRLIGNYRTEPTGPNSTLLGSGTSLTMSISTNHPLKNNLSNNNQLSLNNFLIFNPSLVNTNSTEYFSDENYRLINRDYTNTGITYNTITTGSSFNSTLSIVTGDNQTHNLLCYNNRLYYPTNIDIPNRGNFSNSNLVNSEFSGNPNYSGQTADSVYYRIFKKTTNGSQSSFEFQINAVNSTASSNGTISNNIIAIECIIVKTTGVRTGVLNLSIDNGDGYSTSTGPIQFNGSTRGFSLGAGDTLTQVRNLVLNDVIIFRVKASSNWTGYISSINFNI